MHRALKGHAHDFRQQQHCRGRAGSLCNYMRMYTYILIYIYIYIHIYVSTFRRVQHEKEILPPGTSADTDGSSIFIWNLQSQGEIIRQPDVFKAVVNVVSRECRTGKRILNPKPSGLSPKP